jgi:hypothetical protein
MTAILKLLKLACLPHGHFKKLGMLPLKIKLFRAASITFSKGALFKMI